MTTVRLRRWPATEDARQRFDDYKDLSEAFVSSALSYHRFAARGRVGKPVLMRITIGKTATRQIGMNIEAQSRFQLNPGLDHSEVNFYD